MISGQWSVAGGGGAEFWYFGALSGWFDVETDGECGHWRLRLMERDGQALDGNQMREEEAHRPRYSDSR